MGAYIKDKELQTLPELVNENYHSNLLFEAELNLARLIIPQVKHIATKRLPTPNMSIVLLRASLKLICDICRIVQVIGAEIE